jgi:acyl carrier protein
MEEPQVLAVLHGYILDQVLFGSDIGLDARTPLLEWGIVNSMQIIHLLAFIERELGVVIPSEQVVMQNFRDLAAISRVVVTAARAGRREEPVG